MYARHEKVYPREVAGRFARLRTLAVVGLLGTYYGLPWLSYQGRQAVLFDLPARKFYIFGLVLWPQDFIFLTWLLVLAGLSLFFFTAVGGRLWCGYACPQTVWTELFVRIERFVEGDRARQIKRDRGPWTTDKWLRKGAKQVLWILLALWTGVTFVGFFAPIGPLVAGVARGELAGWALFWSVFYGFATYGNAGFLREQVCKYMCPYARFQSAMFDQGTLVITYDTVRGEPRGPHARGVDPRTLGQGDCIDCTLCVQVCPTGIDIREGLQYECIACAACIDACDGVMDRVGRPRGLVRYTSQAALDGLTVPVLRPRVVVYGLLLTLIAVAGVVALSQRSDIGLDVIRDRNVLYRDTADGIENVYNLKLLNKDERAHRFRISVEGLPDLALDATSAVVAVGPGEVYSAPLRVIARHGAPHGIHPIRFRIVGTDDPSRTAAAASRFIAP
jgi:cytochrome c oxidase accessory protein FixG